MGWINVKDQIPKDGVTVLAVVNVTRLDGNSIEQKTTRYHNGKPFIIGGHFSFDVGEVLYWQPLPPLPSELDTNNQDDVTESNET